MEQYTTTCEKETEALAERLGSRLCEGDILAFRGNLGAGKTAFTRGLAKGLGITDSVSSPTFALVHEYHGGRLPLYHFDMYRVEGIESLESTGFFDYLVMNGVLAIEWSEKITDYLPEHTIFIEIEYKDEQTRDVILKGGRF